jgi:hypothetical protein
LAKETAAWRNLGGCFVDYDILKMLPFGCFFLNYGILGLGAILKKHVFWCITI